MRILESLIRAQMAPDILELLLTIEEGDPDLHALEDESERPEIAGDLERPTTPSSGAAEDEIGGEAEIDTSSSTDNENYF